MRFARPFLLAMSACALAALLPPRLSADPRPPVVRDAADLRLALDKVQVVGSALYIAAHPDDENTAMLAWLSRGRLVRAGYLSMTRGDGGQNLLGTDVGEKLGVIRTQELLAARRIDGAEQFFTRALDFGFSKNPEETLAKWDHDKILADVVWVIRSFQPDIIITRFPPDSTAGHGHHTASAMLAEEAFTAAADSTRFPEQLAAGVRPWQARRLVWNVFRFGNAGPDTTRGRLSVDLGAYSPLLGRSFTEIAGESRSMHKTQGFGAAERRGTFTNAFQHKFGDRATNDLFDGVDLTWSRFPGGARVTPVLARAAREFDAAHPDRTVGALLEALDLVRTLPDAPLVRQKQTELVDLIRACGGLWFEAIASRHTIAAPSRFKITTAVLSRGELDVSVKEIHVDATSGTGAAGATGAAAPRAQAALDAKLRRNEPRSDTLDCDLPATTPTSEPYWLSQRPLAGAFDVRDQRLIGRAENAPPLTATFRVTIAGHPLEFTTPVVYRWTDPVQGERYRDVALVPPVALRFDRTAYLFPDLKPRTVRVNVSTADRAVKGTLALKLPAGWKSQPASIAIALAGGEADTTASFVVTPGAGPAAATVGAEFRSSDGVVCDRQRVRLDYAHIPIQTLLPPAEAHLVRTDVKIAGANVAYVMGSGDQIPDALEQMGYRVTLLSDDELERRDLSRFDAIVIGVRAYNTRPRLKALTPRLLEYVHAGGRLVTQYQTADPALDDRLGPYPFKISRDRVTVEEAPMRWTASSATMKSPNAIAAADFDGWVQERGLYYASPFDSRYVSQVSANDPGETPKDGGLLFARYGQGTFVYAALAFFRQLPAGVPGAYRLFANVVSPGAREAPPKR